MSQTITTTDISFEEYVKARMEEAWKWNEDKVEVEYVRFNEKDAEEGSRAFYAIEVTVTSHDYEEYTSLHINGMIFREVLKVADELGFEITSIGHFQHKPWNADAKLTLLFFSKKD